MLTALTFFVWMWGCKKQGLFGAAEQEKEKEVELGYEVLTLDIRILLNVSLWLAAFCDLAIAIRIL